MSKAQQADRQQMQRVRHSRQRGSNRCHYPLNWLGHASTSRPFPSYIFTSLYYNSVSTLYCLVVHPLYIIVNSMWYSHKLWRWMLISSGRNPFSFVFASDLQINSHISSISLSVQACHYSRRRKWTLCSNFDGKNIFCHIFVDCAHHWLTGGRKSWRSEIGGNMPDSEEKHSLEKHSEEKYSEGKHS